MVPLLRGDSLRALGSVGKCTRTYVFATSSSSALRGGRRSSVLPAK
ncbi:hypothetical protein AWB68_02260 [Caballeronia choica]|uniref:Uncharacterized protein n=1 Tax=Caballeronia choica TaxID=326476 RepID=A0A158HRF9_9BURK|nr:hypothetical protein AWB68_02260 [Caballeronia choica]